MALQQRRKKLTVKIKLGKHAVKPCYAHKDDAGMDLFSAETVTLKPMQRKLIGTKVFLELPENLEAQVRPKSGLALNHGITLLNTPGTIDPGYRGEIKVIAINLSSKPYKIEKGQKIAQIIFSKFEKPKLVKSVKLSKTKRGTKGFGSTGLR